MFPDQGLNFSIWGKAESLWVEIVKVERITCEKGTNLANWKVIE
jgi:hypothetical protein